MTEQMMVPLKQVIKEIDRFTMVKDDRRWVKQPDKLREAITAHAVPTPTVTPLDASSIDPHNPPKEAPFDGEHYLVQFDGMGWCEARWEPEVTLRAPDGPQTLPPRWVCFETYYMLAINQALAWTHLPPEQEVSGECERKDCNWVCGDNEHVTGAEVCLTCKSIRAVEQSQGGANGR